MGNAIKLNPKNKSSDCAEKAISEDKVEQTIKRKESEGKSPKDCRDNCMHCGSHCIYLKND